MRHEPVQHLRGNPFAEPGKYGFPKIKNIGHNILREIGENGGNKRKSIIKQGFNTVDNEDKLVDNSV